MCAGWGGGICEREGLVGVLVCLPVLLPVTRRACEILTRSRRRRCAFMSLVCLCDTCLHRTKRTGVRERQREIERV